MTVRYRFAVDAAGALADVATLTPATRTARGPYACVGCARSLVARVGAGRAAHFAHRARETADECGPETYLHQLAKRAFSDAYRGRLAAGRAYLLTRTVARTVRTLPRGVRAYMSIPGQGSVRPDTLLRPGRGRGAGRGTPHRDATRGSATPDDAGSHRTCRAVDVLHAVVTGQVRWLGSTVVELETARNPNAQRRRQVTELAALATDRVVLTAADRGRALAFEAQHLGAFDALHLAAAERGRAEVLLTTDDRFVHRAARLSGALHVRVLNPTTWAVQELAT